MTTLEKKHLSRRFLCIAAIMIAVVQFGTLGCTQSTRAEPTDLTSLEPETNPSGSVSTPVADQCADDTSSPIFGVKIPVGYRQWELISVSENSGKNELKGILGNGLSMKAYREGTLPFPDGSTLVKLTWKREPLAGFDGAFVPGPATMVQVMVKDSKKYGSTGGWGFGRFIDGKPVDEAQHKTCFTCHSRNKTVTEHDFVFTLLAP
jgi:hypothetical protein